MKDCCYHMFC